jgi:tetratricopeptide (TPR) repeat protein
MNFMDEREEKDSEQEFDEDGFDPTKEAFFSDLIDMEEEVANEAYELVEHAIHLIETKYFDDGIEVLRQAIGLYTQINRQEEIRALNEKISEVYLIKEQAFRESESDIEKDVGRSEEAEIIESTEDLNIEPESDQEEIEVDLFVEAEQFIKDGKDLLERNKFEEALDKYDKAIEIFEETNNPEGVDRVFKFIEECYKKKAEFLQDVKIATPSIEVEKEQEELQDVDLKGEKLKKYLISKKKEEEMSSKAYDIIGKAADFAKNKQYDESLQLYNEGVKIFQDLNWTYEVKKVQETIIQLEKEKQLFIKKFEEQKIKKSDEKQIQIETVDIVEQQVKDREEQEKQEKLKRLKGIEFQRMENDFFKAQIDNMATEASRMAREYELAMQKAIKKGELVEECVYPKVIETYEQIKELLIDKGWRSESAIYDDTIKVYYQKLKQDKKIRQIENEKAKKQKETEESLKIKKSDEAFVEIKPQIQISDEQRKREIELQNFRAEIDEITSKAERIIREYELALRKGKFELKCPYPEIINIYKTTMHRSHELGWETDVAIFSSQIQMLQEKFEKDKKLRQIEAEKALKQKQIEDTLKSQKDEEVRSLKHETSKTTEVKSEEEEVKEDFDQLIDDMVNKAELMAREYDLAMKKAVRQGKLADDPPFAEIIKIYERVKQMLLAEERNSELATYNKQLTLYSQKWEKDKKLREIESQKAVKQKEIEEMHKIGKKAGVDKEKLKIVERKKEEEEFRKYIMDEINKAEKLVRDHEIAMRKAIRKGEILEDTPYSEVLGIYREIREKVYARDWIEQAEVYSNQIKIYEEKLEKHVKLLEVEVKKIDKQKEIEEMHKVGKESAREEEKLLTLERKKDEEEEFERYITDNINKAEKLVRNHESAMRKAMKKGKILEDTPYSHVIEIYREIREKVYARGWKEQADVYGNQIKIYQEKLDKHEKLIEVEAKKAERQKEVEDMHKVGKESLREEEKLLSLERKKEEEGEFERYITDSINRAEKLVRDHESSMRKAMKKGIVLEDTPYSEVIDIYKDIREKVYARGWKEQADVYGNQIKIYQEKLDKHGTLIEVEAKKAERQREIEEMHKIKEDFKPAKPDKIKEMDEGLKEEDIILDNAMNLIDEAEKKVKNYELSIKTDVLFYESPYNDAISNYQEAKKLFQKIGWNDEASRLINTIKFYKEKKEKDEKLRDIEKKKLEEPTIDLEFAKKDTEKDLFAREKVILELEKAEKEKGAAVEKIFGDIHKAERIAQEYEIKIKDDIFDQEPPYEDILQIYRKARKDFEEIGWIEESMKLINTIKFYKEKQEKDSKLRALEIAKVKKRDDELLRQQRLLKQAKKEQERLLKQRKESLILKEEKVIQFETAKDKAFGLMDKAKSELNLNNFERAIDFYKESEEIFSEISWQEGINMVKDSIAMIKRRKKSFEIEQATLEKEKIEKLKIEEKLEEKISKAEELRKLQQEEKRKELLRVQSEKEWESEISEEAYKLLEEGTSLSERKKFEEAYEKYIEARKLFDKISWKREVSRINNDLLFKLKRERKTYEILEDIKKKKVEEEMQMETLKKETERERRELKKQKKEDKRKLAREEFDKKIFRELERAEKHIEDFKYNEGILLLIREKKKLEKLGKDDEIKKVDELINDVKDKVEIPLVTVEPLSDIENLEKFEITYKALDKAQISLENNRLMKAVSELNEAKYNLEKLKIGYKYIKEIDVKIRDLKERLGRKPSKVDFETKEKEHEVEMEKLKSRIAARREERRKKVLDLLKKD